MRVRLISSNWNMLVGGCRNEAAPREGIRKRKSVALWCAKYDLPFWWVRSRDATVRHYIDESQDECKYSPFSRWHNVQHCTSTSLYSEPGR